MTSRYTGFSPLALATATPHSNAGAARPEIEKRSAQSSATINSANANCSVLGSCPSNSGLEAARA